SGPKGSTPSFFSAIRSSTRSVGTTVTRPNCRMSVSHSTEPSSRSKRPCVDLCGSGASKGGTGCPPLARTWSPFRWLSWPASFRWTTIDSPPERSNTSIFARRRSRSIVRPSTDRRPRPYGSTSIRGLVRSACRMRRPISVRQRSSRSVSTSGSSGTLERDLRGHRQRTPDASRVEEVLLRPPGPAAEPLAERTAHLLVDGGRQRPAHKSTPEQLPRQPPDVRVHRHHPIVAQAEERHAIGDLRPDRGERGELSPGVLLVGAGELAGPIGPAGGDLGRDPAEVLAAEAQASRLHQLTRPARRKHLGGRERVV